MDVEPPKSILYLTTKKELFFPHHLVIMLLFLTFSSKKKKTVLRTSKYVIIDSDSHCKSHVGNQRYKDLKINPLKIKHERTQIRFQNILSAFPTFSVPNFLTKHFRFLFKNLQFYVKCNFM